MVQKKPCYDVGGTPNGLALAADGAIWFCDAACDAIRRFDPADGTTRTMADAVDGVRLAAPNDLVFHSDGALVFTCPGDSRREPTGYVGMLAPGGAPEIIADGLLFPNGIAFSTDGKRVFVAETYGLRVQSATWTGDKLGLLPLFDTPGPIGADGVAVAPDGRVYTCVHGAGIVRVADAAGTVIADMAVPDAHPAGCAIDPAGRWPLIVTGTQHGILFGLTSADGRA